MLQDELDRHYPSLDVTILGVNEVGQEEGNELASNDRTMPLLQDVDIVGPVGSDMWQSWQARWRDVRVVDRENELQFVVNLTDYPLEDPAVDPTNYNNLKQVLINVGKITPTSPYQAEVEPLDVDESSQIAPLDALLIINELGKYGDSGELPPPSSANAPTHKIDPNGSGTVEPADALRVINHLIKFNSSSVRSALSRGVSADDVSNSGSPQGTVGSVEDGGLWAPLSRREAAIDTVFAGAGDQHAQPVTVLPEVNEPLAAGTAFHSTALPATVVLDRWQDVADRRDLPSVDWA